MQAQAITQGLMEIQPLGRCYVVPAAKFGLEGILAHLVHQNNLFSSYTIKFKIVI